MSTSCSRINEPNMTDVAQETVIPNMSITTISQTEEPAFTVMSDYSVESLGIDMSFFESLDGINDKLGINIDTVIQNNPGLSQYSFEQSDRFVVYIQDYQTSLSMMLEEDPITGEQYYYPTEDDFHRLRRLKIDQFSINEYDSSYWAEYEYRGNVDLSIANNLELSDSSHTDGYCFIYDTSVPNQHMFYAVYLIDNYTINYTYSFNHGDVNDYIAYLDLCDILGLPVSEEMTEEIIG